MQHPDEGTIHAWLDDALDAAESQQLMIHVASCDICAAAVAEARGLIAASSRIINQLDGVPRNVVPNVVSEVAKPSLKNTLRSERPTRFSVSSRWRYVGFAAAAVLGITTTTLLSRTASSRRTEGARALPALALDTSAERAAPSHLASPESLTKTLQSATSAHAPGSAQKRPSAVPSIGKSAVASANANAPVHDARVQDARVQNARVLTEAKLPPQVVGSTANGASARDGAPFPRAPLAALSVAPAAASAPSPVRALTPAPAPLMGDMAGDASRVRNTENVLTGRSIAPLIGCYDLITASPTRNANRSANATREANTDRLTQSLRLSDSLASGDLFTGRERSAAGENVDGARRGVMMFGGAPSLIRWTQLSGGRVLVQRTDGASTVVRIAADFAPGKSEADRVDATARKTVCP